MSKTEKFEDLKCWQEARQLVKDVFIMCRKEDLRMDYELEGQMKRASLSVMNNIAEGFGRYSHNEFVRFLNIAQSSAQEVMSMSYVLIDLDYVTHQEFENLQSKVETTKRLTLGLIKYLKSKNE